MHVRFCEDIVRIYVENCRKRSDYLCSEERLRESYVRVRFCEDIVRIYGEIGLIICIEKRDCASLICMFDRFPC